jgi:hypothetical protein
MSSTAMSIPFFVEMPNVAVSPVSEPNSPTTISDELESDLAPVQDVNNPAPIKHEMSSRSLRITESSQREDT